MALSQGRLIAGVVQDELRDGTVVTVADHGGIAAGIILSGPSNSYGPVRAAGAIDLTIAPGETVALLGRNGAGQPGLRK